ncbi:hypothetical protein ACIQU4_27360 [Streptomyces sp. NPDC090741]|uniref:hypothetical protein n=1 Tax=Streptomyces sp. NPDC090741 TaxID=3365967 RepID=UPI00381C5187
MTQPTDAQTEPEQFAPRLTMERFDEVVWFDKTGQPKPPQNSYERLWQGERCGPDFTADEATFRPTRLRARWFQAGDDAPCWNSMEVTGHEVRADGITGWRTVRQIWTSQHADMGQVPPWILRFVGDNPPAPRSMTAT